MLKEAAPRRGFLEYGQFQRLRAELPEYLRPIFTMAFYTGMRLGEILNLRWESVSFIDAEIRLKNDDPRSVPLTGELLEMLRIGRVKHPTAEFIFMREEEHIRSFNKAWRSACVRAGLGKLIWACTVKGCKTKSEVASEEAPSCARCGKKMREQYRGLIFHDLRRTGVRNLVRAGVPESIAMAISGHKTRAVFERYNIVSGRDLKMAATKLEDYLKTQNGASSGRVADSEPNDRERRTSLTM
jgi:integrase